MRRGVAIVVTPYLIVSAGQTSSARTMCSQVDYYHIDELIAAEKVVPLLQRLEAATELADITRPIMIYGSPQVTHSSHNK